jgi:cell wall-associated NlpC family hydrolase
MTPRHRRRLGVFVGIALLLPVLVAAGAFGDPIDEKKAEAARIQEQLDRQGNQVSVLAEKYNQARNKVAEVDGSVAKTQTDVARSDERLQEVRGRLAQAAVVAYMHGGSISMISALSRGGSSDMVVRTQYLRVTAADQRRVIGELRSAREDFLAHKAQLEAEQKEARAAAASAAQASRAAADAEASQRAVLNKVNGDLATLVAAEQARREAEAASRRPVVVAQVVEPTRPAADAPAAQATTPTSRAAPASAPAPAPAPAASGKGATAVAEARKQLGKPYEYGGSGPDSFDCSGLTSWAWRAAGVSLSHSAYDQWFQTTRVRIDQVQPGDLLFFGDNGVESIHHVALYIGDGSMIEASQTGTPVRIRAWRSGDLVGAGRPG